MIYGQFPFAPWHSPEGLNVMRSASDSALDVLQIYLETWSLRETLSWGTHLELALNDITSFALFSFKFRLSLLFSLLCQLFYSPNRRSSACIRLCLTLLIWYMDLCSLADRNHFLSLLLLCFPQPHHSFLIHNLNWVKSFGPTFNNFYF